jgi:hypothetical protein
MILGNSHPMLLGILHPMLTTPSIQGILGGNSLN